MGKPVGFIEYTPIETPSRVVYGDNYFMVYGSMFMNKSI